MYLYVSLYIFYKKLSYMLLFQMSSICFKFIWISFQEGKFWSLTCLNLSAVWQKLCSTTLNSNLRSWEMTCDTEKLHLASHLSNKVFCNGLKSFLKLDLLIHFISFKIRKKIMCWQKCQNYWHILHFL